MIVSLTGLKRTPEQCKRISIANTGRSEESKRRPSKIVSESEKEKRRITLLNRPEIGLATAERNRQRAGWKHTDEAKEKIRIALNNRSKESREKAAKSSRGQKRTDEQRQNIIDGKRKNGHVRFSEETKRKISEAKKNPSDDTRKKMSESGKKRAPMSEITRKKLSDSTKLIWANRKGLI